MFACLLLVMGLSCDQKPESLLRMEEARKAVVFADVVFSVVWPNATNYAVAEPWFHRNFIARDQVAHISVGTKSGITAFTEDGKPKHRGPTGLLRAADGSFWMHNMDTASVQHRKDKGVLAGVYSFRSMGMSYRDDGAAGPAGILAGTLPKGEVAFTETVVDGLHRVEASNTKGNSVVWYLDPNLNWNPTKCELWNQGKLVRQSQSEYEQINGVYVLKACAFLNADGSIRQLVTVESATVNDPDLPTDLTPEYIGVEPGMTVRTYTDTRQHFYAGDGKTYRTGKVLAMERRGEIEFGPKVKARRAGQPIDWFIPDPKRLKKELEIFRKQLRGPLDDWQRYTLEFIAKFGLDEAQTQRALHILRSCQLQRDHYLRVKQPQMARWKQQLPGADDSRRQALQSRLDKVDETVRRIFERQLKPRLDNLPTRGQRAAAEPGKVSERSKQP